LTADVAWARGAYENAEASLVDGRGLKRAIAQKGVDSEIVASRP
jgi:hypothetical protein